MENVINKLREKNVFIHGPGGTGKTYLIKELAEFLSGEYTIYKTALTGIAAMQLSTLRLPGRTLHSWAGINIFGNVDRDTLLGSIKNNSRAVKRWKYTRILIVDEVSMLGSSLLENLDYIAKDIRNSTEPFGGIRLLFCGDLLQLPPVKDKFVYESNIWKSLDFVFVNFEKPMRYKDVVWFNRLNRIRKGKHTSRDIEILKKRQEAYKKFKETDILTIKPTILQCKKIDVESYNLKQLEKLPGKETVFLAEDDYRERIQCKKSKREKIKKMFEDHIPEKIILKPGAQVMLKANLDVDEGLVNGSRGVVVSITKRLGTEMVNSIEVRWINNKQTTVIPYTYKYQSKKISAQRTQIPLVLAWSMTVHKSQGCTLDYACCDLGENVFCEGQAYVALSRVRSYEGLFLINFTEKAIKTHKKTLEFLEKNVTKDENIIFVPTFDKIE